MHTNTPQGVDNSFIRGRVVAAHDAFLFPRLAQVKHKQIKEKQIKANQSKSKIETSVLFKAV